MERARGFTLVEVLVTAGILAAIGGACTLMLGDGTAGVRRVWQKTDDAREVSRLLEWVAADARSATRVLAGSSSRLNLEAGAAPASSVRYVVAGAGAGAASRVVVSREVRPPGGSWKQDPLRPVAAFASRPGETAPVVRFSSRPATGRVRVTVTTPLVFVEETVYSRFN